MLHLGVLVLTLCAVWSNAAPYCSFREWYNDTLDCRELTDFAPAVAIMASTDKKVRRLEIDFSSQLRLKKEDFEHPAFEDLSEFQMYYSRLMTFDPTPFRGLKNLTKLSIDRNFLTSITPEMFSGLSGIKELSLNTNSIANIDAAAFYNLPNLHYLNLQANELTSIPPGVFQNTRLKKLLMNFNHLTSIDEGTFQFHLVNFTTLILDHNNIRSIDPRAFRTLPALEVLNLEVNDLDSLDDRLFVENLRLHQLVLTGNNMENISNFQINSSSLKELSMDYCTIRTIPAEYFNNLPDLRELDLGRNYNIESLDSRLFIQNPRLYRLVLDENNLDNITNFQITSPSLQELSVFAGNIQTIPADYFNNLPNLRKLDLGRNRIDTIAANLFANNPQLSTLWLNNNNIKSLNVDSFQQLYKIWITFTTHVASNITENTNVANTKPVFLISPNPWNCSNEDMITLRSWCDDREVPFDDLFQCIVTVLE